MPQPPASVIPAPSDDEVDVAELVPEIALGQRLGVGSPQGLAPGDRLEHPEMAGRWLMQPGEQGVNGADAALACCSQLLLVPGFSKE